ncbi:FAD-binding oxidoreductase [Niabella sp. 3A5MI-3]|nr:FAD-dependent oxidoreductase [Niabella beijingensis]MBZ4191267.1 FAD-binding oxidoreductase [Niabella beijingensis]
MGAGFTGIWTALYLQQKFPSKKVLVVERGATSAGASLRNAGFACFGSPTEILSDIALMGNEKAVQLLAMRFEGLRIIQKLFANGAIDFNICKGYELLDNEQCLDRLRTLNEWLYEITGSPETFSLQDDLIARFGFAGISHLVENRFEGSLHPGKLLTELHRMAVKAGVRFLFCTEVREVKETPSGIKLTMTSGPALLTDRLVYCTNAFSSRLLPKIDLVPARGQVLLTAPVSGLQFNGTFHYQEGYYYFRNLDDRILLGGARHTSLQTEYTLDEFTTLPIQQALEHFLSTVVLPGQRPEITHRWAGIMAMGTEKMPVIEQLTDRSFCALRMSGMGVALAPVAGKKIAELM